MLSSGRTTSKIGPFFYSERRSAAVIKDHLKSLFDSSETKEKASQCRRDRAYVIPTGSIFVAELWLIRMSARGILIQKNEKEDPSGIQAIIDGGQHSHLQVSVCDATRMHVERPCEDEQIAKVGCDK